MIYMLLKLESCFPSGQCTLQCHINRTPELNVEFSMLIQVTYRYFTDGWVLKILIIPNRIFSLSLPLTERLACQFWISVIYFLLGSSGGRVEVRRSTQFLVEICHSGDFYQNSTPCDMRIDAADWKSQEVTIYFSLENRWRVLQTRITISKFLIQWSIFKKISPDRHEEFHRSVKNYQNSVFHNKFFPISAIPQTLMAPTFIFYNLPKI